MNTNILNSNFLRRYSRHLILKDWDLKKQERISMLSLTIEYQSLPLLIYLVSIGIKNINIANSINLNDINKKFLYEFDSNLKISRDDSLISDILIKNLSDNNSIESESVPTRIKYKSFKYEISDKKDIVIRTSATEQKILYNSELNNELQINYINKDWIYSNLVILDISSII